jgi:hypothetical protein
VIAGCFVGGVVVAGGRAAVSGVEGVGVAGAGWRPPREPAQPPRVAASNRATRALALALALALGDTRTRRPLTAAWPSRTAAA